MAGNTLSLVLPKIVSALSSLIELAERKSKVVAAGETSKLDDIVSAELALTEELAGLERDRMIASAAGVPREDEEAGILRSTIREKVERLKTLNERNQRLLKHGLDLVEFELKLFMPQTSYKGAPRPGPMVFDQKV